MNSSIAPRSDGFSAIFFQRFWPIVGEEITQRTLKMMNDTKLDDDINDNIIVLIPKKINARGLDDYRPISLCQQNNLSIG